MEAVHSCPDGGHCLADEVNLQQVCSPVFYPGPRGTPGFHAHHRAC